MINPFRKYLLVQFSMRMLIFLLGIFLSACSPKTSDQYFLFAYFIGNGEDGLHLASSSDGLTWKAINTGKSLLYPLVGESTLMRDPCIILGPDSTFHMVWTTSWSGNTIGYASSKDLIQWSRQQEIPVMAHEDSVLNCWAPEINYHKATGEFVIYWSSTITDKFPNTANSTKAGKKRNHRVYYTTTKDFEHFSDTKLLYEPGVNVIDACIKQIDDRYVMFIKNETELPEPAKNISIVFADNITGPYGGLTGKTITGDYWAEGPTAILIDGKWHVYFDKYRDHRYGLVTSTDLENWTDESEQITMPEGIRHGTAIEVSKQVFDEVSNVEVELPMLYRDQSRLGRPYAKDPTVVFFKGKYLIYYSLPPGKVAGLDGWHIGIAQSANGRSWEKLGELLPDAPYETRGLCAPEAQVIGDELHLFYQTYGNGPKDAICHAVSIDGIHFTRNATNPIFAPTGDWNAGRAIDAEVFIKGDSALLYWATRDKDYKKQFLGVSVAPLSGGFKKYSWKQICTEPILKPELPWEINCIEAATVFEDRGKYYMFYAGAYNHEGQLIGLAISDDAIHWKRTSDEPILAKGNANEWNATESGHPGVFVDNDGSKWLYFQGNPDHGYTYYLSRKQFEISEAGELVFVE